MRLDLIQGIQLEDKMQSLAWPNMFSSNHRDTLLLSEKEAIKSNLLLLLNSEKLSLFGDPYYGVALKQVIFQPQDLVLVDLIIDEIITAIELYLPQIYVAREHIQLRSDKINLYATIQITYRMDNTSDMFNIVLTNNQEGY